MKWKYILQAIIAIKGGRAPVRAILMNKRFTYSTCQMVRGASDSSIANFAANIHTSKGKLALRFRTNAKKKKRLTRTFASRELSVFSLFIIFIPSILVVVLKYTYYTVCEHKQQQQIPNKN